MMYTVEYPEPTWFLGDAYDRKTGKLMSSFITSSSKRIDEWTEQQRELGRDVHTWWEWD